MPIRPPVRPAWPALAALARLDPPPAGIVLVLDGPADDLPPEAVPPGAQVVTLPVRSGPSRARNQGARQAGADILLFVDSDVVVPPDTVARVQRELAVRPHVAAVFGSYDEDPADPGFFSQYRNLLHHYVHQQSAGDTQTFWAGLGAVRRTAFEAVGGFDERYRRPSIEDIELGGRLHAAGHAICLVRDLQGRHLKRWTWRRMLRTDLVDRGIPWTRLILAQKRIPSNLNLDVVGRASTLVVALGLAGGLAAVVEPLLAGAVPVAAAVLGALNARFYAFLARRRGWLFTLQVFPWHFVFYVQCGLAALMGTAFHLRDRLQGRAVITS